MPATWGYITPPVPYVMRTFSMAKPVVKTVCSLIIALLLSTFASKNTDTYIDSVVMIFTYFCWMFFCLPKVYRKLNFKLCSDVITILACVFIVDFVIFGMYRRIRNYVDGHDSTFELMEQRAYIFFMNFLRIAFVILSLLKGVPAYIRQRMAVRRRRATLRNKHDKSM